MPATAIKRVSAAKFNFGALGGSPAEAVWALPYPASRATIMELVAGALSVRVATDAVDERDVVTARIFGASPYVEFAYSPGGTTSVGRVPAWAQVFRRDYGFAWMSPQENLGVMMRHGDGQIQRAMKALRLNEPRGWLLNERSRRDKR